MTEFGKLVVASTLSVLAHVSLFAALALMPERSPVQAQQPSADSAPLEVTIQPAEPQDAPSPVALNPVLPPPDQTHGIQTQIDPANLKKAEVAPKNPTAIAAHDSEATPAKTSGATLTAQPMPPPAPVDSALTLQPVLSPSPAEKLSDDEPVGIAALGSYGKAVGNPVALRWEFYRQSQKNLLGVGEVRLKFSIDAQGRVSDVRILSNTANPANASYAVRAVKEAQIPPIPPERLAHVAGGRIEIVYSFTIYPTQ